MNVYHPKQFNRYENYFDILYFHLSKMINKNVLTILIWNDNSNHNDIVCLVSKNLTSCEYVKGIISSLWRLDDWYTNCYLHAYTCDHQRER